MPQFHCQQQKPWGFVPYKCLSPNFLPSPHRHPTWLAWIAARPFCSSSLERQVELLANILLIRSLLVAMLPPQPGRSDRASGGVFFFSGSWLLSQSWSPVGSRQLPFKSIMQSCENGQNPPGSPKQVNLCKGWKWWNTLIWNHPNWYQTVLKWLAIEFQE